MRLSTKGPRSLTRTSAVRWLLRFSTISHVLKGSVWCAAVISIMSYTSPLAARRPWYGFPYQDASPVSS